MSLPLRVMRYTREITALVGGPYIVWVIGWGNDWIYNASMAIVALLALYEFLDLGRKKGYAIPVWICLFVTLVIMASFVLEPVSVEMGVFATLLIVPATYVFTAKSLEDALPSSAVAGFATMYVGMLGGSLIRLR